MQTAEIGAHRPPAVKEIHIVWMTTGLGCDGDSVSITAATLPSVEEVVSVQFRACRRCTFTIPCLPMKSATIS